VITDVQKAAIAKIEIARPGENTIRGTGFLVTDRLVLTAMHVVADREKEGLVPWGAMIKLSFRGGWTPAEIVAGCWNADEDWALLECAMPPQAEPLPLGQLAEQATLETYGFPDANAEGMVFQGRVVDPHARYDSISAMQLFSDQAAAGQGAPVSGLSGAPCIVGGQVVGLMRSALMTEYGEAVAGTLYACPSGLPHRGCGDRLPALHIAIDVDPTELQQKLENLIEGQFNALVGYANVPTKYISTKYAPIATRAQEVMEYFKKQMEGDYRPLMKALETVTAPAGGRRTGGGGSGRGGQQIYNHGPIGQQINVEGGATFHFDSIPKPPKIDE